MRLTYGKSSLKLKSCSVSARNPMPFLLRKTLGYIRLLSEALLGENFPYDSIKQRPRLNDHLRKTQIFYKIMCSEISSKKKFHSFSWVSSRKRLSLLNIVQVKQIYVCSTAIDRYWRKIFHIQQHAYQTPLKEFHKVLLVIIARSS